MRITPTREQTAYLAAVGIGKKPAGAHDAGAVHGVNECNNKKVVCNSCSWATSLFLIIALLLLVAASVVQAQAVPPDTDGVVSNAEPLNDNPEALEPDDHDANKPPVPGAPSDEPTDERPTLHEPASSEVKEPSAPSRGALPSDVAGNPAPAAKSTPSAQSMDMPVRKVIRRGEDDLRKDLTRVVAWVSAVGVIAIGLVILGARHMNKRVRKLEQGFITLFSETATTGYKGIPDVAGGLSAIALGQDRCEGIAPTRPRPLPLPSPSTQTETLIASTAQLPNMRVRPALSSAPWRLGFATHKGQVRAENQDYGLSFTIDGHDVLIVADGCGGLPHGQRAAYLAVVSAAGSIITGYGLASRWRIPHVRDAAAKAILDATHRLAVEGDKLNVFDVRGGLRTTLIVVIGNQHETGYAYIGDGGGCIVTPSGEVHHFLDPQKAPGYGLNVLAASLGPVMEGEPVTGVLRRTPGELVIIGTDGVFDRVDKTFPKDVLRGCIRHKGNLAETAEHILAELAACQDSAGYICDDNLSIGILGDGTQPGWSSGFWSEETGDALPPLSAVETTTG